MVGLSSKALYQKCEIHFFMEEINQLFPSAKQYIYWIFVYSRYYTDCSIRWNVISDLATVQKNHMKWDEILKDEIFLIEKNEKVLSYIHMWFEVVEASYGSAAASEEVVVQCRGYALLLFFWMNRKFKRTAFI